MKNNYGMFHFKIEEVLNKKKIRRCGQFLGLIN